MEFAHNEDGVSPGQACVLYSSEHGDARVLGGGFICATEPAALTEGQEPSGSLLTAATK